MTRLEPMGDRAFLATFADEREAAEWASALRRSGTKGVAEVVSAYQTVGVHADPDLDDLGQLLEALARFEPVPGLEDLGRPLSVPVLYDGEDLPEVAQRLGLTPRQVVEAHTGRDYRVFAIGFQPGFPYAGYLPDAIRGLARRQKPRTRVPEGAVAIVGRQTAIYPSASPGGWHLIGRTPLRIVDLNRGFFPIRAGDSLRFAPIERVEYEERRGEWLSP